MKEKRKGILIVDDDMLLSMVYERQIEKLGFEALDRIVDGETAISAAKDLKPDLILMDIVLKGNIDGVEVMKKIREFSEVPVIYITGNSDKFNAERAKETDYIDFLVKPITMNDLQKSVDKVLGSKGNES
ncbi:MAG TPA: response regulator [Balneolales bacterium]|nr:response regulator [Balneolales bacterium]